MHIPVLLQEVIDNLNPQDGEIFVDGTLNRGGHAKALALRLGKSGQLIGIDQDETALVQAKENLKDVPCRVSFINGNFRNIVKLVGDVGVEKVDGVLFDLGFSSDQIEHSGRGFSFKTNEPLVMSFSSGVKDDSFTAADMVNDWAEESLADVIYAYGEETFARKIAKAIVESRQTGKIETTGQLVEIIKKAVPSWYTKKRIHFATKTFQALRITVNDELGALKDGLTGAWELLKPNGRLAVISFHSLEARIIKDFMRDKKVLGEGELVTKKAVKPARAEVLANSRSRSAQLRVIRKIIN
jgi:16S rRNA (cytosine1402-N4)-methyltransferase